MKSSKVKNTLMACTLLLGSLALAESPAAPGETPAAPRRQPRILRNRKPAAPAKTGLIELNSATKAQLKTLPGISAALAEQIIKARPYLSKANLETRHVLPPGLYGPLHSLVYVHPPIIR